MNDDKLPLEAGKSPGEASCDLDQPYPAIVWQFNYNQDYAFCTVCNRTLASDLRILKPLEASHILKVSVLAHFRDFPRCHVTIRPASKVPRKAPEMPLGDVLSPEPPQDTQQDLFRSQ